MNDPMILRRLLLNPAHIPTGKTRHVVGGEMLSPPAELRIVRYLGDPGYYLFYCDNTGKELTDTYHDTLAGAVAQAAWEFSTKEEDWEILAGNE